MNVREIMRKNVATVSSGDSIIKVLRIFSKKHISGVPVMKGNELVGIITDGDIIAKLDIHTPKVHLASSPDFLLIMTELNSRGDMSKIEKRMKVMKKFKVKDFMTKDVFTVRPGDSLTEVAGIIHKKKITRVPVVNRKGKLVGIVARQDLIRAIVKC